MRAVVVVPLLMLVARMCCFRCNCGRCCGLCCSWLMLFMPLSLSLVSLSSSTFFFLATASSPRYKASLYTQSNDASNRAYLLFMVLAKRPLVRGIQIYEYICVPLPNFVHAAAAVSQAGCSGAMLFPWTDIFHENLLASEGFCARPSPLNPPCTKSVYSTTVSEEVYIRVGKYHILFLPCHEQGFAPAVAILYWLTLIHLFTIMCFNHTGRSPSLDVSFTSPIFRYMQCSSEFLYSQARDGAGQTPIFWACKGGHSEMVTLLLSKGAHINAIDKKEVQRYSGGM